MRKLVKIICECGNERMARQSRVQKGEIKYCAICAKRKAAFKRRKPAAEKAKTEAHHVYKSNAKIKKNIFNLTKDQTSTLFSADCHYCGDKNSMGIDRLNNDDGYTVENSVSCCRICNYAKRDMKLSDFLNWIRRVHAHTKYKGII